MSAPIFLTTQPDNKEKTILENMKTFIEKIIIDTKREQGEKSMTDVAESIQEKLEKEFGGFWMVFITPPFNPLTKQVSEYESKRVNPEVTNFLVSYEDEIYKIYQSKLHCKSQSVHFLETN